MPRLVTPIDDPSFPEEIEDRLKLSRELHIEHAKALATVAKPNSLRGSLVGGSIVLASQHHSFPDDHAVSRHFGGAILRNEMRLLSTMSDSGKISRESGFSLAASRCSVFVPPI